MKTSYSPEYVRQFLETTEHANPETIEQLTEGHISQALSFETIDGDKQVLRISAKDEDFKADQYAFDQFGDELPIPKVLEIGRFGDDAFYCVTERARGSISNTIPQEDMPAALPSIHKTFAKIFETNVSGTTGYGDMDITTGNASYGSWNAALLSNLNSMGVEALKEHARNIDLDPHLVDGFVAQFHANLSYASEVRRLLHGDLGFDNLLLDGNEVTAVIDWAQMGYGDWMRDFAKFDFWWPNRFGDPKEFAEKYQLDMDSIQQRTALYWATTALETISFSDRFKNKNTTTWLHEHAKEKLI